MGGDCNDIPDPKKKAACEATPPPLTDGPLYLAQSTPGGQVTGIGTWGQVAPIAKKAVPREAVKRDNEDHGLTNSTLPVSDNTPEGQRRARAGAAAQRRADASRAANHGELQPDSMGILSATTTAWGASATTEVARRGHAYYKAVNDPRMRALEQPFTTMDREIAAETAQLRRTPRSSPAYAKLEERVNAYKKLKLGDAKTAGGETIAADEMTRLEGNVSNPNSAFSQAELDRIKALRDKEALLLAERGENTALLRSDIIGGGGRIMRGVAGGTLDYWASENIAARANAGGNTTLGLFASPSMLEVGAVSATSTAPVPGFVPGANGPWYARVGARALYELGVSLTAKTVMFGWNEMTDPAVEERHLNSAKAAQTEDHTKQTSESMNSAIDAWKALKNHDNQIQQAVDDVTTQIGTADPAKLKEVQRDLVALHAAFGESWLDRGTRVGGPDADGHPLPGSGKIHEIFAGRDFDFGGVAYQNLNAARNVMNELHIPASDPVAKRIYSSLSQSDLARIMNPHSNLNDIYGELKTMVTSNNPDAKWLSAWLPTRIADQKKALASEESQAMAAKQAGQPFTPQFNNYVLAKIYMDQAMLDMAYASAGEDAPTHMRAAHDALKEAQRLGWDGREIKVNGVAQKRESDLPALVNIYKGLGGTVDW